MTTFAQFHIKKEVANRSIICGACVLPSDERLGVSHAARLCARCQKPLDVGLVVQVPRPIKSRKK